MNDKLRKIQILATDFDGVWTDGKVIVHEDGSESVVCDRRDTNLLKKLTEEAGVYVVVISKEKNPVVSARCKKMNVDCYQGSESASSKAEILQNIAKERGVSLEDVVFMGDDINDLEAMKVAGIAITVADGHEENKKIVDYITTKNGGDGAVREVIEMILKAKGISLEV